MAKHQSELENIYGPGKSLSQLEEMAKHQSELENIYGPGKSLDELERIHKKLKKVNYFTSDRLQEDKTYWKDYYD